MWNYVLNINIKLKGDKLYREGKPIIPLHRKLLNRNIMDYILISYDKVIKLCTGLLVVHLSQDSGSNSNARSLGGWRGSTVCYSRLPSSWGHTLHTSITAFLSPFLFSCPPFRIPLLTLYFSCYASYSEANYLS